MRRGVKISFQKISRLALTTVVLIIVSGTALSTAGPRPMCASPAFYPSSPISLYDQVQTFSRPCAVRLSGKPLTLIVPSEAYIFVGALLGQAYTVVSDSRFDRIVILGYDESANPATVYSGPDLVTPMGGNPVDNALCAQLLRISPANLTDADPKACLPKSIEIQLPFLQKHFPRVPVVPIGIDGLDPEASLDLGNLLAELTKDNPTLFIVVTNLSSTFDIRTCESRDNRFVEKLKNCRFAEIMTELEKGTISLESSGAFIAGITPAILAGADDCKVLRYENTGRITGDHQRVCGYLSAVITGDRQISGPEFEIPAEVGAKLLKHARSTIEISAGKLSTPVPKSEIPENIPIDGIHIDIITDFRASGVG
ncbi:MAG TPA: AmmeMemoRadiSam system protein B, partial [candidate division Zixibacteria bacterium]|nr:AmmeMemoRadiSam system protein B [candidate division Zixibacteria bacterium]